MNSPDTSVSAQLPAPQVFVVLCVALAYCVPGLIGHQPWKPDEGYIFAGIFHMLQSGDWVIPHLAGETFMEKPPLYHWMGMLTASLTSAFLPMHDGARLASGVFVGIALWATALAGRMAWGAGSGRIAVLVMLGTLGLLNTVPLMLPDLPLLAGFAVATLALVAHAAGRKWAFLALGCGVGMGFLAKGLLAPGAIVIAVLALPVCFAQWRERRYVKFLLLAALVALPWITIWPALLFARDSTAFVTWLWDNNIGRFLGFSVATLGAASENGFWAKAFPWFVFPWWIFIAICLWQSRARCLHETGMQVGLAVALSLSLVLVMAESARVIYALPMLPALALATTGAFRQTPRYIWSTLAALGLTIALGIGLLTWFFWGALTYFGHTPDWHWIARQVPVHFLLPISPFNVLLAAALSVGLVAIVWQARRQAHGRLLVWTASLAVAWALPMVLLMPWIDTAKGYRGVYDSMASALPSSYSCIQSEQLGESERGILEYTQGIRTVRNEVSPKASCPFLLRQTKTANVQGPNGEWDLLWSGGRQSGGNERFQLYASSLLEEGRVHAEIWRRSAMAASVFLSRPDNNQPYLDEVSAVD
ncbi:MAG: glycosyltransferase family 39 protein [Betaproteobacteria bacterium]